MVIKNIHLVQKQSLFEESLLKQNKTSDVLDDESNVVARMVKTETKVDRLDARKRAGIENVLGDIITASGINDRNQNTRAHICGTTVETISTRLDNRKSKLCKGL